MCSLRSDTTAVCKRKLCYCTYSTEVVFRFLHDGPYYCVLATPWTAMSIVLLVCFVLVIPTNEKNYPSVREDNPIQEVHIKTQTGIIFPDSV